MRYFGVRIGTRTGLRVQKYILTYVVNWVLTEVPIQVSGGKYSFFQQIILGKFGTYMQKQKQELRPLMKNELKVDHIPKSKTTKCLEEYFCDLG